MTKSTVKAMPALLSIAILAFTGTLIETSMNVTFPTLMRTFNVSLRAVQWLTSGYLVVMALTMMCSAFLQWRFSLRALFDTATVTFVCGAGLSLLATHQFGLLLLGRLIQAGCAGIAIPLMITFILSEMPAEQLGYYMSTAGMIVNLAPALGPTFGGLMTTWGGWRLIFLTTLPIVALTWLLGRRTLTAFSHPGQRVPFQFRQFGVLALAFLLFNFALGQLGGNWSHRLTGVGLLCVCVALLAGFNRLRHHNTTDLLNLSLFQQPAVRATFMLYAMIQLVNLCVSLVIPTLVQLAQHVTAFRSGLILLPGSLLVALINPWFGKLYDQLGGRVPIVGGLLTMMAGLIGLVLTTRYQRLTWVIGFFILFSVGRTMSFGNTLTTAMQRIPQALQADLNALYSTGQQLAGSVGTTLGATLLALPLKTTSHPSILLNGQVIFGLLAVYICGLVLVGLKLFRRA